MIHQLFRYYWLHFSCHRINYGIITILLIAHNRLTQGYYIKADRLKQR